MTINSSLSLGRLCQLSRQANGLLVAGRGFRSRTISPKSLPYHLSGTDRRMMARSERFELPTLGFEVRCSIQLSYERASLFNGLAGRLNPLGKGRRKHFRLSRLPDLAGEG
jgi:hypothetical protein